MTANVRQAAAHRCGALVIQAVGHAVLLVPPAGFRWEWEGRVRVAGGLGTLLGPEGTGRWLGASGLRGWIAGLVTGSGSDGPGCFLRTAQWTRASLADDDFGCCLSTAAVCSSCVFKCLRAYGGCLGIRSR